MGVMGSPKERPLWVGRDPTKVWEPPLNNTFLSVCDKKNGPTGFDFGRFESTTIPGYKRGVAVGTRWCNERPGRRYSYGQGTGHAVRLYRPV